MIGEDIIFPGVVLKMTSDACPEQYEAFDSMGKQVGYMRLRHGNFTVSCPSIWGEIVYESTANGDGAFNDDERDFHLQQAVKCIKRWRKLQQKLDRQ